MGFRNWELFAVSLVFNKILRFYYYFFDLLLQAKKSISVELSNLDMVVNLQTWVILLEFFGIGSQQPPPPASTTSTSSSRPAASQSQHIGVTGDDKSFEDLSNRGKKPYFRFIFSKCTYELNIYMFFVLDALDTPPPPSSTPTDLNVNIKSLVFYLNKELYPLAKASVSSMKLNMMLDDGNQDIQGSVGRVVLMDLTPYKGLYEVRYVFIFVTRIDLLSLFKGQN